MSDTKITPLMFTAGLAVAAVAGVVGGYIVFDSLKMTYPGGPVGGSELTAPAAQAVAPPNAAAIAAAESQLVKLYEGVNNQFVAQLRKYGTRMDEIAAVAEAEGATTAASQMRDFGKETEDLIARYDKIAKQ